MTTLPAISSVSRTETAGVPYITVAEFQEAPTGVQLSNLVVGGSAAQQTAMLAAQILRASSWMDLQCRQVLAATLDTETYQARVRRGTMSVFPRCFPIRQVTAISVGPMGQLQPVGSPLPMVIQDRSFSFQPNGIGGTAVGPLQFNSLPWDGRVWVQYTYVSGYPVTTLAEACVAGANSITPQSVVGIVPGMTLTISDLPNSETVVCSSVSGAVVNLTSPTAFGHAAGALVSAMPASLRQIAVLATAGFISTQRGSGAIAMPSLAGPPAVKTKQDGDGSPWLQQAEDMLAEGGYVARVGVPSLQ